MLESVLESLMNVNKCHNEARSVPLFVFNDDLARKVDEKIHKNKRFTMTTHSEEFPQKFTFLMSSIPISYV